MAKSGVSAKSSHPNSQHNKTDGSEQLEQRRCGDTTIAEIKNRTWRVSQAVSSEFASLVSSSATNFNSSYVSYCAKQQQREQQRSTHEERARIRAGKGLDARLGTPGPLLGPLGPQLRPSQRESQLPRTIWASQNMPLSTIVSSKPSSSSVLRSQLSSILRKSTVARIVVCGVHNHQAVD